MVRRCAAAGLAAVAAAALATTASGRHASGPTPAGQVVLGTLNAPPSAAFLARVRRGQMSGVLLLGRWPSASEVTAAIAQLQQAACTRGAPLLVAVDQEGGLVRRFPWAAPTVAPAQMSSAAVARDQARAAAATLKRVGVSIDLAPVVDTPGSARSFLGTRAFSRSATQNATLAQAFVAGLQSAGIAATAKHFPGLGEASGNTDLESVAIRAAKWKLTRGLLPFKRAIAAGVELVMVSSASYPALDPSGLPAVLSPTLITGLLRGQLGFDGVVVTDALNAPAPAAIPHAATKSIDAGADLLVFGSEASSEQAYAQLVADAKTSASLRVRLAESGARIRALESWLAARDGPACP